MKEYRPQRGVGTIYILLGMVIASAVALVFINIIDSYVILNLVKLFVVCMILYCLYYLSMDLTVLYRIDDEILEIHSIIHSKNVKIPVKNIIGYGKHEGKINGTMLSGIGNNKFAFGRSVVEDVGFTYMYAPSCKEVIYIKTEDMSYGISPSNVDEFEKELSRIGIEKKTFDVVKNNHVYLYKDKKFMMLFILTAVEILFITLNPFILYLQNSFPEVMPIDFNANFEAVAFVKGKEFAFRQMEYGVFNMIVLVCMYYASHFCAKYDKNTSYKYIYVSLILALAFLIMQVKIITTFI